MTMAETLKDTNVDFEILATDVSTGVLKIAQNGIYSINEAEEIPSRFRQTYILKSKNPDERLMRIRPNIREKVRYQALNLVAENYPLREHFDIIFCRNVMIYLDKQTQNRIVNQLYAYTNKNGLLVLGQAEGSASQNTAYKRMRGTIFQKR
jgi:chemotaxis protein methyltransferase CheR